MRNNVNLELIRHHLDSDFEQSLMHAAIYNLLDENNSLRFSNYAYAFRELFLHVIKRMAPDDNVERCEWFTGRDEQGRVARRNSYKYIIQGGVSDQYILDNFEFNLDEVFVGLRDAFNSLNRLTHISDAVFPIDPAHGNQVVSEVESYVSALFTTLDDCHSRFIRLLGENVGEAAIESAITETIESVDILSTHSSVDEVDIDRIDIIEVNHDEIIFEVSGSVSVGLQWGSNSDVRNDIGATGEESFPFSCKVTSSVRQPDVLSCDEGAFRVDTSSWYE